MEGENAFPWNAVCLHFIRWGVDNEIVVITGLVEENPSSSTSTIFWLQTSFVSQLPELGLADLAQVGYNTKHLLVHPRLKALFPGDESYAGLDEFDHDSAISGKRTLGSPNHST